MSENYQENNRLPEQPLPEGNTADFGSADTAGKEKILLPPARDEAPDALSDETSVADHNDLYQAKSDALLENARGDTDSAAEAVAAQRLAEPDAAPEVPAPLPPAEVPPEEPAESQELTAAAPVTVVPTEAEISIEPTPRSQHQSAERKRKVRKALLVAIPILILTIVLAVLTPTVILPEIHRAQAYDAAEEMLAAGMHDDASAAFSALGDYRDSRIMALEARYQKAEYLASLENYEEAIAIWLELGSYSDSAARADQAVFDWKDDDYQAARRLMEEGQFLAAADAFAALGDYMDSISLVEECKLLQKDADYQSADAALAAGDYAAAIEQFKALGTYADAQERFRSASYEYGCLLLEEGKYEQAIRRLNDASGYEDAGEKKNQAYYLYGCALLKDGKYDAAITQLGKCGDYKDAADQILKAKYGYVQANMSRTNSTTQAYLKTLISENYSGAQKLYNELYAWKVEIIAYNNSPYNSTTTQSTISKYGTMCIHFKITGGEPGASIDLVGNLTAPNGQNGNIYFNGCKDGDTQCAYFEYYQPAYGATGTMTLRIYDSEGNLMATGSVRVTN